MSVHPFKIGDKIVCVVDMFGANWVPVPVVPKKGILYVVHDRYTCERTGVPGVYVVGIPKQRTLGGLYPNMYWGFPAWAFRKPSDLKEESRLAQERVDVIGEPVEVK